MGLAGISAVSAPRGVDLSLDDFSLASTVKVHRNALESDASVNVGAAFWSELDGDSQCFRDEDRALIGKLFNPKMSDRRHEGERFVPPDVSLSYVHRLRNLLKAEEDIQHRRKIHFCSETFADDGAGSLFPSSWTPEPDSQTWLVPSSMLHACSFTQTTFSDVLKSTPIFDKNTEDGVRFRIYREDTCGVEVRSMQEPDGDEMVVAAFSIRPSVKPVPVRQAQITKATEYVERVAGAVAYFVVFDTDEGRIATQRTSEGVVWQDEDLDARCLLAKVTRSVECQGTTLDDIAQVQAGDSSRDYARNAYIRATQERGKWRQWATKHASKKKPLEVARL